MEINTIRERRKRKLDDAQLSLIEHLKSVKTTNEFPSLRELVFQSIAKNIVSWITAEVENEDQNYESPFECLSTKDTLAILNAAIDINYDEKHCLKLFIHKRLKAFDFSLVSLRNSITAFKYFTQQCKGIKELSIPDPDDIPYDPKKAMGFPPMMTYLEYKDLVNLYSEYNFVEILSLNHKSIKSLKIPGGKMDECCYELLSKCDQLQKLSLISPNKLDAETLTKILSSLPMLNSLSLFDNNIDFELLDLELRFNNILTLDIGHCKITNQGLGVIVTIMPNIQSLSIYNCFHLDVKCFDIILKLENLKALNTSISDISDLYSNGHFEQFLMKQGDQLISIDLSSMDGIDTTMLAKYCSNIETLNLNRCFDLEISWICKSDLTIHENSSLYNHLIPFEKENYSLLEVCHKLHTLNFSDDNYNEDQLQMLFSGNIKALRNLELSFIECDHENFITKFFSMFHFKYLEKLNVYFLPEADIPKKEVYTILRRNVYLKELNLYQCYLPDEDIEDIKDVIEQSKSNVKIDFERDTWY